jgi:hypothetical protein
MMVALFVSAILATVMVRLFSVTSQTGREELARSSTEGAVLIFMRLIERDLQHTTPAGISLAATEDALVVHPMGDALSTGQIVYQDLAVLWSYDPVLKTLRRREYEGVFSPFTEPQRLDEAEILALKADPNGRVARLLSGVTSFKVKNPPDVTVPQIGSPLTVEIEKEVEGAATRPSVKYTRAIYVRTGGN